MSKRIDAQSRRKFLAAGGALLATGRWADAAPPATAPAADAPAMPDVGAWTSESPFLRGAFAPVFDERDDAGLVIRGAIPRELRGVFMRNGPNPMFNPDAHYAYPFDGTGMLHAIYLENGRARYRNRWVMTQEARAERAAGHRIYNSSFSAPPHADLANTNIVHHAGHYLALYEEGVPYEVDRDANTLGTYDYDGRLPAVMSAHPKIDPVSGELLSLAYDLKTGVMTYLRADRSGRLDRIVSIPSPWPAMVHDIAITERHVVAFIGPLVFDRIHPGPPATWQPERGTMVAVIPRDATRADDVQWIKGAPFFQFHTMNAFADGKRIEVTLPWYDSFSLQGGSPRLELHKLVIHTDTGTLDDEPLDDRACEFARINDTYLGRRARFGYVGLRDTRPGEQWQVGAFEAIARYDLSNGRKIVHAFPPGMTVCEPVFVADPRGTREEDGFIFTFVHEAHSARGTFVILDARNLDAAPLATVQLPRRVPAGLHGSWTPA